jgi:hypothetical protein
VVLALGWGRADGGDGMRGTRREKIVQYQSGVGKVGTGATASRPVSTVKFSCGVDCLIG